jgi:hypothetical protein
MKIIMIFMLNELMKLPAQVHTWSLVGTQKYIRARHTGRGNRKERNMKLGE